MAKRVGKKIKEARAANAKVVRDYLNKIKFHFFEREGDGVLEFHGLLTGDGPVIDTYSMRIIVDEEDFQSFFSIPSHVPTNRRGAMAEFIAYVNWGLKYGEFVLDMAGDGELQYHVGVPASVLRGDPNVEVDRLIGIPAVMLDRYTQGVIGVLQGKDPKDAYDACEKADDSLAKLPPENLPEVKSVATDVATDYSLDGLNVTGRIPLEKVVAAVRRFRKAAVSSEKSPRLNILLSGPSGCGKTEFVKYLGAQAGAKVMTVTASDVMSPMVGRTEQNLARIFSQAKETGSILFLDEVDSLLGSRDRAQNNWECVQTNELLQQMERFGGIMVGATNFESNLDPAVGRRFTFKLKLDYLSEEGKLKFFGRYFKTPLSDEEKRRLGSIANLTPGDFRTVRERLYFISENQTNDERLAALEAESESKGRARAKIGF